MTDAQKIAAGLTEAQRAGVLGLSQDWAVRNVKGAGAFRVLYRHGVAEWDRINARSEGRRRFDVVHRLTPLGLEVRKILEREA